MNLNRTDIKLVAIFVLVGFLLGPKIFAWQRHNAAVAAPEQAASQLVPAAPRVDPFANIKLTAKSAYVWDIAEQKALYSKDGETPRTLASITKMMTAVVALESATPNKEVAITKEDLDVEGSTDLRRDEKWSLKDLLALTLVESSNHGASAIAASVGGALDANATTHEAERLAFVSAMNDKSKQLGLATFAFTSPSGLDAGSTPGGTGSAQDVAKLFEYVLRHHSDLLQYTALPSITVASKQHIAHRAVNTDEIAAVTPGIVGGKTGYTDMAGGNLAVVVDVGIQHPIAIIALGSTRDDRFTDVKNLLAATQLAVSNQ